jgi:hypothetical protein
VSTIPTEIDLKNSTIYIRDAGTNFIEIRVGEGNLTYSVGREIAYLDSRGLLDRVREGKEQPCEITFQFIWEHITTHSGEVVSVQDALTQSGAAANWASTSILDPDAPYSVDIIVLQEDDCQAEELYFQQFHWENLAHDLRNSTVDCTGKCNATKPIPSVPE